MEIKKIETLDLINSLYKDLEVVVKDKLSTAEHDTNQFWWEVLNKIFTILISFDNALRTKDSLTTHLVGRYVYEMLIVCEYVTTDSKLSSQQKIKNFLSFNQFLQHEQDWKNGMSYKDMLKEVNSNYLNSHRSHYRHLSNYAHSTRDSFLLNRRGQESEFLQIINTSVLSVATILEIIKICFERSEYFNEEEKSKMNLTLLHLKATSLSGQVANL